MIPDEAVEAAAKAAAKDDAEPNWYLETERFRDAWRTRMRAALEAAAPTIMGAAFDEGFRLGNFWHGWILEPTTFAPDFSNPYTGAVSEAHEH